MAPGVLVAGGTGALGGAVVAELLDAGHSVTATWIVAEERDRLSEHEHLHLVEADCTDPDAVERAVGAVEDLGAVVNLVGGFAMGARVHETDQADFERQYRLNLTPAFLLARATMPRLLERGGGAFVCVSARAALQPFKGAAGYISSKAAVLAFVKALDADYKQDGIRCNAVLPSTIDTPANRRSMPDSDHSRWVPPAEIAQVIRFLVSEDSAPVSGAGVPVYGRV
jgi:NAD(P)-dependent dehydrogenase (short-subunit alcohol dehydrogenase family)